MEYRRLGNSDLEVSVITLGCWEFGNTPGFATADQAEVDAVVHAALEAGVNLFDTAQVYSDGRSEELLGRALRGRREKALIATKFLDFRTWTRDEILDRLKASLGRLDTDYVDLYQMHWPLAQMTPRAVEVMAQAFEEILRTGLARAVGVSNFRLEHLSLLSEATADRLASNAATPWACSPTVRWPRGCSPGATAARSAPPPAPWPSRNGPARRSTARR